MAATDNKTLLVTGGCGYIGSHTLISLIDAGWNPVTLDNLSNSSAVALERVSEITGKDLPFLQGDIRDAALLDKLFSQFQFSAVLHFAGLKSVGESVRDPLRYYDNNVAGTLTLLNAMHKAGVKRFVFSSSATVYAAGQTMPLTETSALGPINAYGDSKLMVEQILQGLCRSDPQFSAAILRYFNPTGAHASGLIGEDPSGIPENLVPYIAQVATGQRDSLTVFGGDYDTVDGTGVRDYIHITDLAEGHVKALEKIHTDSGAHTWNLGTGTGYSVLEMIAAYEKASGITIAHDIGPRRPGDVATCYADPSKARSELGWQARLGLAQMMADNWRWRSANPRGYNG